MSLNGAHGNFIFLCHPPPLHCTDPHQCHNHHKIDYSPHIIRWRETGSIDLDVHLDSFNSAFDAFVDQ